jgi:CheY-like chemotaxis protein
MLSKIAFHFNLRRYIMGGVEALRRVRAAGVDMPIIALTASVVGRCRLTLSNPR